MTFSVAGRGGPPLFLLLVLNNPTEGRAKSGYHLSAGGGARVGGGCDPNIALGVGSLRHGCRWRQACFGGGAIEPLPSLAVQLLHIS